MVVAFDVRVSGRVQGVGYRYYARSCAATAGVTGYVRNVPDGTVEAIIVGPAEACEHMLTALRKGPLGGRVDAVSAQPLRPPPRYEDFRVTY
ncbi:acylphosphatase [Candidatus Poribacteria bacterium]|jgi:acylphosphatase|nr:acylphosphatase [Candidatus Poribacteria bacterium]MBT5533363.1 acylphosphatase [Candidatus Poribacteria bacterium]MBT5715109.1 acylphosphatase [Candidatus Poribacteria bacterium]MBT7099826.1 acylphosphatase [Candidatus Poribacteria bacterium]MBT7809511.1 acylphosphatase [Candidatus Poribacteria bacterium]